MDGANLVTRGVAEELALGVIQDINAVHAELLRRTWRPSGIIVGTAVKGDGVSCLEGVNLGASVLHVDGVFPGGR